MALAAPKRITADEYFSFPVETRNTQLIDGVIVVNAPALRHQRIRDWIVHRFYSHMEDQPGQGEGGSSADLRVSEWDVFVPDAWWTSRPLGRDALRFDDPPDLVVEVRSTSTWHLDIGRKKDGYEARGVPELWLVDTKADEVTVHRRSSRDCSRFDVTVVLAAGDVLTTPLIEGFSIDVGPLFDR
jgi:Uma2 family endonuclease